MSTDAVLTALPALAPWLEETYVALHGDPELSMQETKTAGFITAQLVEAGYETHQIGGGVVGILRNGDGPTVLFRADIDGLPVKEDTGLAYASTKTMVDRAGVEQPVMHACGHDMHIAAGLGAARLLAQSRDQWRGTYVALFQPGEETAEGAKAMVDAGLVDTVGHIDVALGQHVLAFDTGKLAVASGPMMSQAASLRIVVTGKGSHGSMPHLGIDPILLAASIVTRLQGIVARELAPGEFGVVTVGALQTGTKANIIPNDATLLLNIRAYSTDVYERLLAAIRRIVDAECAASNAPAASIEVYDVFPLTDNDAGVTEKVRAAFVEQIGADCVVDMEPVPASEDFSTIPDAFGAPYCYWGFGGVADGATPVPNHNPGFAPVLQPTLTTGTQAAVAAILAFLANDGN